MSLTPGTDPFRIERDGAPRVLLVYANPAATTTPVAPYGMERIAQSFQLAGCQTRLETPFLEADPLAELEAALAWEPDLVGFSVRNVDDTLVVRSVDGLGDLDTDFYLDAVRPLVQAAVARVGPDRVVVGGAAVSAGPEPIARFLGASIAVMGPAEDLCWRYGRSLVAGRAAWPDDPRVLKLHEGEIRQRPRGFGRVWRPPPGPTPRMGPYLSLTLARRGRVAVQIAHGCDRRCAFCVEPRAMGHVVVLRPVDDVVAEVDALERAGVRRLWLTASEVNVPGEAHVIAILKRLAGRGLDLRFYLQPAPVTDALLDAVEDAGIDPTGLNYELGHLDDTILRAGGGPTNRRQIDALVELYLRRGYRQLGGSVLFGAHWHETEQTLSSAVEAALAIDAALPDGLGLAYATGGRVYPETPLADWIASHRVEAAPDLYGDDDPGFVRPVVFSRPMSPRALLAWVQARLVGAKGPMAPMNTETPASPAEIAAEALVNRGIVRAHAGRVDEARDCFEGALVHVPDHLEALRQLALLLANHLGDRDGAVATLERLQLGLGPADARRAEIETALGVLRGV